MPRHMEKINFILQISFNTQKRIEKNRNKFKNKLVKAFTNLF